MSQMMRESIIKRVQKEAPELLEITTTDLIVALVTTYGFEAFIDITRCILSEVRAR